MLCYVMINRIFEKCSIQLNLIFNLLFRFDMKV